MDHYERIAKVIRFLDRHYTEQPDLAALARSAGLSRHHFHRLFSSWAGITPKDFVQCLTLAHARALLRQGQGILESALDAGLSGPGRLHDLCVSLEAASPGEVKSGGDGWTISVGVAKSPFGPCLIGESPRGICHLSFVDPGNEKTALHDLKDHWPRARFKQNDRGAAALARRVFRRHAPGLAPRNFRAVVRGSPFQLRVWQALIRIPQGKVVSYGDLAAAVGAPNGARAVGSAVAQNPIAYLIPCHRVIRETGVLGGYKWDPLRKRALLAWESRP